MRTSTQLIERAAALAVRLDHEDPGTHSDAQLLDEIMAFTEARNAMLREALRLRGEMARRTVALSGA